jgi:shikimate kinase
VDGSVAAPAGEGAGAHVILVGLPGVGKSTVGRAAAQRAGLAFVDFDEEIERREGRSVARIFEELGEPRFRAAERALTAELRGAPPAVLAPGGGWIESSDVVGLLRPPARLVYLRATPATVLRRLGEGRAARPLLVGPDPAGAIERIFERRRLAYESADVNLDTEILGIEKLIDAVVQLVTIRGPGYVTG